MEETPRASFFSTFDWLTCYWKHFGNAQRLRVLAVHSHNRIVGILPLVVRTEVFRIGPVRILTYPLHDWGTFYGPIGPNSTATLLAGFRHIRETRRDWDLLELRWIDNARIDKGRTELALRQVGLRPKLTHWKPTAQISLAGDWQTYWQSRKAKWRENVRRNERALARRGRLRLVKYRSNADGVEPRWDFFDSCVDIARQSWQGSSHTGTTMSHESIYSFLRDSHEIAARLGALDVNLLYLDEAPIAFTYNYFWRGNVEGLRMGRRDGAQYDGAGTVLMCFAIRQSFELKDRYYDLGADYLSAKQNWLTSVVPSYRCTFFPWTSPRTQLLRLKRWCAGNYSRPGG